MFKHELPERAPIATITDAGLRDFTTGGSSVIDFYTTWRGGLGVVDRVVR